MSESKVNASDDEFHDALGESDPVMNDLDKEQRTHDAEIDELIKKQNDLILLDETEQFEEAEESLNDEATTATTSNEVIPEMLDEHIDEDALREMEKTMSEEELRDNKEKADKMKLEGNEYFKNDDAVRSVEVYTEALKICPTSFAKERAVLYGNRAAAKIKLDSKKSAIDDCSKAVELWPEYVRAILRRGKLYEQEDKLDEALEDYKRVYELDPSHQESRVAMARLPPLINERNERLKEEMVSKLKDLGNMFLKPFGLSTNNFQMQQDPNSGSYSINFNQSNPQT